MTELNRSEKSLQRLVERGKIRVKEDPRDPRRNLYNAADIARILSKRESGEQDDEVDTHVALKARPGGGNTVVLLKALLAAMAKQQALPPAPPPKLWMRLDEAESYSGLPRSVILKAVKSNEIKGLYARCWIVQKAALDRFSGMV